MDNVDTSTGTENSNQSEELLDSDQVEQQSAPSDEGETEASDTSEDQSKKNDQGDDEESQDEASKSRKKNGFKKRIDRLNRNISERDNRISTLQQELEKYKQSIQGDKSQGSKATEGEPNPDDYDTNAEYIRALNKYERELEKAEAKKEAELAEVAASNNKLVETHTGRVNEFKKSHADFDQVVTEFREVFGEFQASQGVLRAIMKSPHGPKIVYDVLKDHDEYERLSEMSEDEVLREIYKKEARIEFSLESQKNTQPKTSKAPAPVSPVGRGAVTVTKSLNDPNLSFAEYEKLRKQQLKNKK